MLTFLEPAVCTHRSALDPSAPAVAGHETWACFRAGARLSGVEWSFPPGPWDGVQPSSKTPSQLDTLASPLPGPAEQ